MNELTTATRILSAASPTSRLKFVNITAANRRIAELESQLSAAQTAAAAVAPSAAQSPAAAPAVPATVTSALLAAANAVWPGHCLARADERETRTSIATRFWQARLTYPGCEADFARLDHAKIQRDVPDDRWTGRNRAVTVGNQATVDAALRSLPARAAVPASAPAQPKPTAPRAVELTGRERMKAAITITQ